MEVSDQEEEPCEFPSKTKAMGILEILEVVIKNVENTADLMRCRQVNSTWKTVATKVLIKRKSLESVFRFCEDTMTFELFKSSGGNSIDRIRTRKKIDELNECLDSCTDVFPCVDFTFSGGNLGKIEIQDFLKLHGIYLKNLTLELYCESSNKHCTALNPTLHKLLTEQAPYIEKLCIPSFPEQWQTTQSKSKLFPNDVVLPALKYLKMGLFYSNYDGIISEMLIAAKNLISFENIYRMDGHFHVSYIKTFTSANKIQTIKNFDFRPRDIATVNFYSDFANAGPKLKYLTIYTRYLVSHHELYHNATLALNKILESSKDTLEVIHLDPIGRFPGLEVPVLSNLNEIKVNLFSSVGFTYFDPSVFPPDFQFATKFPRLSSVKLEYRRPEPKSTWTRFFPFPILSTSVKSLKIKNYIPSLVSLKVVSESFPALEHCSLGEQEDFPSIAKDIWRYFSHLDSLNIMINVDSRCNRFPYLDSAIIGFSPSTCQEEGTTGITASQQQAAVLSQENHESILNMKNLKDLKIKFYSGTFDVKEPYKLFSSSTIVHGLGLLTNVRISVDAFAKLQENRQNLMTALEPLSHYMNLER